MKGGEQEALEAKATSVTCDEPLLTCVGCPAPGPPQRLMYADSVGRSPTTRASSWKEAVGIVDGLNTRRDAFKFPKDQVPHTCQYDRFLTEAELGKLWVVAFTAALGALLGCSSPV